jgi:hypothetical protein
VTRKSASVATCLKTGTRLRLGSPDVRHNWGHARDYLDAMWLMLQHPTPSDYMIGAGISRSLGDMVEVAFRRLDLRWLVHTPSAATYLRATQARSSYAPLSAASPGASPEFRGSMEASGSKGPQPSWDRAAGVALKHISRSVPEVSDTTQGIDTTCPSAVGRSTRVASR